jgi:hypothetical protein
VDFAWQGKRYSPVGQCIYCGADRCELSDEHIIPFGLLSKGIDWLLPKASCGDCAKITTKFEGSVQRGMLSPLRRRLGLKTRRKRPTMHNVTFNYPDGGLAEQLIPMSEFPMVCLGFRWLAPGLLRGVPPQRNFEGEDVVRFAEGEMRKKATTTQAIKIGRV